VSTAADPPTPRVERAPRGRVSLYAIAFVMLLVSGWLQVKGNLTARVPLVRWSIGVSAAAALVAVASVLVPGRRPRPPAEVAKSAAADVPAAEEAAGDDRSEGSAGDGPAPAAP
jgi:hypothetical protein